MSDYNEKLPWILIIGWMCNISTPSDSRFIF